MISGCLYVHYLCVCLGLGGGIDQRRHRGTDRDDSSGQQDDDEDDDEDDDHNDHDQLDVFPPVRASHFRRCLLEVLSLSRERNEGKVVQFSIKTSISSG